MRKPVYDENGTVESIVRDGLCTQCGFCEPVCPTSAIHLTESSRTGEILPVINADACVMCPLCLDTCPGANVDFTALHRKRFGDTPYERYSGYIESAWLVWASDDHVRTAGASGGAITALGKMALRSGLIDYLVFARPRSDDPFRSETLITSSAADLEPGVGSLYFPVPLGEGVTRARLEAIPREGRLGLIGLPCHIHGALKLSDTGWFRRLNWRLVIGIFCGGTWTYQATDTLLNEQGLSRSGIQRFSFRAGGWPGKLRWVGKTGSVGWLDRHQGGPLRRLASSSIFSAYSFFTPERCTTCTDGLADLADLSVGDPWLKSQKDENKGKSLVVLRSPIAKALLESAISQGTVCAEALDPDLVVASQQGMLVIKQNPQALLSLAERRRGRAPGYEYPWRWGQSLHWLFGIYAWLTRLNRWVGCHANVPWIRGPMYVLQSLVGRLIKRRFPLTDRDRENYFA